MLSVEIAFSAVVTHQWRRRLTAMFGTFSVISLDDG
jgi:hypothetical protein